MQDIRTGTSPWMDGEDAFVRVDEVVKIFGDTVAVQSVSLDVARHEIFALLGSSGSGKSTLLRMLAGFEEPTSGRIYLDNEDITDLPPYRRPVNMMFQSYALFPHMSVEANVAFGLKQEGVPRNEIHERVFEALDLVQMAGFSRRKPNQLSGGQQQRVALARSLVKRPKLLLLDEPMSALDKQIRQKTQIELVKILERVGVTCIMVTHDQEEAMTMASRLAVMSDGQIIQSGTPYDVYSFPNSRFVAGFIGSTNLFTGVVTVDEPDHVHIECEELSRPLYVSHGISEPLGMDVYVSIRPEQIKVSRELPSEDTNWGHGIVTHVSWMGSYTRYQIRLDAGMLIEAQMPSGTLAQPDAPGVDEEVYVSWSDDSVAVLST
ncbi:polyamine ABC transporter ATP-binding protein [Alcaligenes ammonioxydans]|jgi:putrescine transport system ATP-binding protein|uniref:Spermidine/putrescine import ATP-binding protein PotA n=1 Tax=Alcaligenes ammonioxydans TaxID=2582914 RepID=A0ABX8SXA7_9BURK|nr:polyamine ABC transporter ATP-binding protein [Alcaligenes ammonioxydans]QBH20446.1 polyamine ABC transporter ATP-binding protein [Alcaligenes faecalis]MCH1879674.1 polyamine ABC transporter ATP-binding protein [Alcaligenes ammonioxydans]QXX78519.1 polyamine ABC transporter ATP-binding protein [Alcaligenes ammonioxydans]WGQ36636.1 polyamine ABC transporter ATP-binding protein [Alcaligenes faecalis]HRK85012.1 polyamine ABC transporter ATP-binding protein [Alcaligenes faecalis]